MPSKNKGNKKESAMKSQKDVPIEERYNCKTENDKDYKPHRIRRHPDDDDPPLDVDEIMKGNYFDFVLEQLVGPFEGMVKGTQKQKRISEQEASEQSAEK